MKKLFMLVFVSVLGLSFFGCGTPPIYNVRSMAIAVPVGTQASMQDVENAIFRAGGALGWQIKKIKPGELKGTLVLRTHTAIVSIKHDLKEYSITYVDSVNLNYDATANTIHSNYNGWIQNLDKGIQTQLRLL